MDKAKKKNIKRVIALICTVALVGLLAAMPLIARQEQEEDGPKASILSGTVTTGSIPTELIGGGTLTEEKAVTVSVPAAVKLTEFLVKNGDVVTEGTAIASVDRVTVMLAISQVQETLEYLSEQIEKAADTDDGETVTAPAGGIVKILYAEAGRSVQSIMLEHGALAVLSLDGLMAVDLEAESDLSVGTAVTVTLSDGTAAEGEIIRNLAGEMTVTVEDDGYTVGDTALVTAEDGTVIGSGELYIYSPWNATAYAGTVDSVKVKVGDKLSPGKTLMKLKDVGYSAAFRQLIGQRQEYEELMLDLFEMYQTEVITAPCDGVISGIEKNSVQLLSDSGADFTLTFLANAPNGDDETLYLNYLGQVTAIAQNGWVMQVSPQAVPIDDYLMLEGIPVDPAALTQTVLHTQTEIPVFARSEEGWVLADRNGIGVGDILLFAADGEGKLVWSVLMQKASQPDQPGTPGDSGSTTVPGGSGGFPSGGMTGGFPSGGTGGGFPSGGIGQQEPAFELYGLDMAVIASVTPQDTMTLEITVDEQDMKHLHPGMSAQVKIDALGGGKYTATITAIGNTGTGNGGSSKYTVELTMDRAENMLGAMNATATIILATAQDVLTIPADALVEIGNQTVVYTGYDQETETLLDPVEVTVGCSDGETVEILEGLEKGQTYYYAYYDTLEIEGGKASGSLEDLKPGSFVTITINGKGQATYVLISAQSGFGGRNNRN